MSSEHRQFFVNLPSYIGLKETHPEQRYELLKLLGGQNMGVLNPFGEGDLLLSDIESKLIAASDGFVFLELPHLMLNGGNGGNDGNGIRKEHDRAVKDRLLQEMFKAASLVVGKQVQDLHMNLFPGNEVQPRRQKPIIAINGNQSWDPFVGILDHLIAFGMAKPAVKEQIELVGTPEEAMNTLSRHLDGNGPEPLTPFIHKGENKTKAEIEDEIRDYQRNPEKLPYGLPPKPKHNVCFFCSASTKDRDLIDESADIAYESAMQGHGIISGCGIEGMMGGLSRGAERAYKESRGMKGYFDGANTAPIIGLEGLPEYYTHVTVSDNIYDRMAEMARLSDSFVILPGGMGTVQETLALLMMRHHPKLMDDPQLNMQKKPIILYNREVTTPDGSKTMRFWDPLIALAKDLGMENEFQVANTKEELMDLLEQQKQQEHIPATPRYGDRVQAQRVHSTLRELGMR